jgi:hypothetical protein
MVAVEPGTLQFETPQKSISKTPLLVDNLLCIVRREEKSERGELTL